MSQSARHSDGPECFSPSTFWCPSEQLGHSALRGPSQLVAMLWPGLDSFPTVWRARLVHDKLRFGPAEVSGMDGAMLVLHLRLVLAAGGGFCLLHCATRLFWRVRVWTTRAPPQNRTMAQTQKNQHSGNCTATHPQLIRQALSRSGKWWTFRQLEPSRPAEWNTLAFQRSSGFFFELARFNNSPPSRAQYF